jgi:hypothetical protein
LSVSNIIEYTIAIVLAAGITSTFVIGLFGLIGKTLSKSIVEQFKSNLQTTLEIHKTKLKKSELLFQKEYEAASAFIFMKQSFLPSNRFPEMDWGEACEDIAQNFGVIETKISSFISLHGAILDETARKLLFNAVGISTENNSAEPDYNATKAADSLWGILEKVEKHLLARINSQTTT